MSENQRLKHWLEQYEGSHYKNKNKKGLIKTEPSSVENKHYHIHADTVNLVNYQAHLGSDFKYVGFWRRLFAFIIDTIILTILLSIMDLDHFITSLLVYSLYYALLTSSSLKATIGKLAIGAIVVDSKGRQISFIRALLRFYASLLSFIVLFIGYFMIAFHSKKKSLHDNICDTMVIDKK